SERERKAGLDLLLPLGLESELIGDLAKYRELLLGNLVHRLDMQRAQSRTSRQVNPLHACLVPLGEGRAARDHRHGTGGRCVIAGPARILEIAANTREGKPTPLQGLDRVQKT